MTLPANVELREAAPDDAEQLLAYLERLLSEPGANSPIEPDEFRRTTEEQRRLLADFAAEPNSIYLVAVVDGRIVGELNCRGYQRRALAHVTLLGMSVAREWRGRGVGGLLVRAMLEWAGRSDVVERIELFVYASNETAIRLYERHGFEVEGRRRRMIRRGDELVDDLIMARLL